MLFYIHWVFLIRPHKIKEGVSHDFEFGLKFLEWSRFKWFGKSVYNLNITWHMLNLHSLGNDPFINKMYVKFNVFDLSMENCIVWKEDCTEIIIQECRRKKDTDS